ncbi:MAG: hypothetical protein ABIV39_08115, partial [Verrucomicrobiota bacterium]
QLRMSTISGAIGAEVLTKGVSFPTASSWDFGGFGDFLPQLAIPAKIDGGDSRIQNVVYRNGKLWATHTVFLPSAAPTRTAAQWWQINTNGSVQQVGRIDGGVSNTFFAYPSIAVNKNNDVLIGYSRFSAAQYPSANYSFRFSSDPASTFRDDRVYKAGVGPYYKTFGGADNRWGDYSGTVVDPINDTGFWTIQEYAAAASGAPSVDGSGRWGTWWGRIDVPINVVINSTSLISETCQPTNGVIDPGETVTVNFTLRDSGADATNVTATLLSSIAITSPSGSQNYGDLTASGTSVARPFTFTANGACGGTVNAVLSIQVGGTNFGTVTNAFQLGKALLPLAQNFDGVSAPALPAGWTAIASSGVLPWRTSTAFQDTSPNSVFAANATTITSNRLTSPVFPITTTNAQLSFVHKYDLEEGYDGGVLEMSIAGAAFGDFVALGGTFLTNGYIDIIPDLYGNPLQNRMAWTGNSIGFVTTLARFPASAAGKQIQLRWICGTDEGSGETGWYVDSITVTDGFSCCTSLTVPTLINVGRNGNNINFSFLATSGQTYTVEYKNSLSISNWTTLQTLSGDGTTKLVTDSLLSSTQRFYRVRSP